MTAPVGCRPRVLIAATVAEHIWAFHLPLAKHLVEQGWTVDAMANGVMDAAPEHPFSALWEIPLSRRPWNVLRIVAAVRTITRVLEDRPYDIVHVHTPVAAFVVRIAIRLIHRDRRPRVVYTVHGFHFHSGGAFLTNSLYRLAEWMAGNWTDALVVLTAEDLRAATRLGSVPPDRIHLIPGVGIDTERFSVAAVDQAAVESARHDLAVGPETPLFVCVAEFIKRKRHPDLLWALRRMRHRDAHLALVGTGREEERLGELARKLGVSNRLHFVGYRHDVRPYIVAARALVLPSAQEGLPLSVMEAMSLGTPVIGTEIRGTRDLLFDGAGLLVPVGDRAALASALDLILDDPAEAKQFAVEARRRIVERYRLPGILAAHDRLYATVLSESR